MWLCFNNGFLSVVADKDDPRRLMVRARRKADLSNICGSNVEVTETPEADYRWRIFIDRDRFKEIVYAVIDRIAYTNFKNSVTEGDLHDLFSKFWELHRSYGARDPAVNRDHRAGRASSRGKADRSSHFVWEPGDVEFYPPEE